MQTDFLASLRCPYSGLPFHLSKVTRSNDGDVDYGIARSEAGDFPIVEGIFRLHLDEYRDPIVRCVRQERFSQALRISFDEFPFQSRFRTTINFASGLAFRSGFDTVGERLITLKKNHPSMFANGGASFAEVIEKLNAGDSKDWQICRFSMPTFLPVFPLLHLIKADGPILDFGSGTGQAAFLISRMRPNGKIVCTDYSFSSLYLSKKYFAPQASYVCLNGNYLLPFETGQFSTVFSSDALHCIDSKLSLVQEFKRIASENSVIILPHLHNRLTSPWGKSFTADGYRALFRGVETQILPEEKVIEDYFFDDIVDLSADISRETAALAKQGLSIVASADPSVFKRRENLWDERIRSFSHPCINPAYRIAGRPGDWTISRHASEKYATRLARAGKMCLPDSFQLTARSLDTAGLRELLSTDFTQFRQLARSLLILDLPERFIAEDKTLARAGKPASLASAV